MTVTGDNKPNITDIEMLEFSTVKGSFELLNKKYRKNHRDMEKGLSVLNRNLEETNNVKNVNEALSMIDKLISNVNGLKRKADLVFKDENSLINDSKRRIDHLKGIADVDAKTTRNNKKIWKNENSHESKESKAATNATLEPLTTTDHLNSMSRFYRLLADHLFVSGSESAAIALAKNGPCQNLCLLEIYEESLKIKEALKNGDTEPALNWYQEANYKLKKTDCVFDFNLRIFEFYVLVKKGNRIEAIEHARRYLSGSVQSNGYKATKLGQAMVLLVVRTADELECKAKENQVNEDWIVDQFHKVLLSFYEFSSQTSFSMTIKAGVTAIKTSYCYDEASRHNDCVVCHPIINKMAKNLPFGRYEHSVLTCRVSNLPINDNNPPMALPNGYVYSQQGLIMLTDEDGNVTCPRSGENFPATAAERIYIV